MQQTLLALCAVAVFSIYALNSTRDEAAMEMRAVTSEVGQAAESVARDRLAYAERLAFDEQDIGRTAGIRITPSTSAIGLDADEFALADVDDLDDLNRLPETRSAAAGTGTALFDVVYTVRYVVPSSLASSPVQTLAKEVTVRVTEVPSAATRGRPVATATLGKVFTPAGMASFR